MSAFRGLNRQKRRTYLLLTALLLTAYVVYGLKPALTQFSGARNEYLTLHDEVTRGQRRAKQLLEFAERVSTLKNEVSTLEQRLSGGNQLLLFLQDAEREAGRTGLALVQINPGAPRADEDVVRQPVSVDVTGSLDSIRRFLSGLESTSYPVRVDSVALERDPEQAGRLKARISTVVLSLGKAGEQNEPAKKH